MTDGNVGVDFQSKFPVIGRILDLEPVVAPLMLRGHIQRMGNFLDVRCFELEFLQIGFPWIMRK